MKKQILMIKLITFMMLSAGVITVDKTVFLLKSDIQAIPVSQLFSQVSNSEDATPFYQLDNPNARVSYQNELNSGYLKDTIQKGTNDIYGRTSILPTEDSTSFYALLLQDTSVIGYQVKQDGTVSQEPSLVFKTSKNQQLLDVTADAKGEYVYVASINDKNIDIVRYKTEDMSSIVVTIDQSSFSTKISKNARIQLVNLSNPKNVLVTVVQQTYDSTKTSTFMAFANFENKTSGGIDLSKIQQIGMNSESIRAFTGLPNSQFGLTTSNSKGDQYISYVCTSKYDQTMSITGCVQVIPESTISPQSGLQTVTFDSKGQAQLITFSWVDQMNKRFVVCDIENDGKVINVLESGNVTFYGDNDTPIEFQINQQGNARVIVINRDGQTSGIQLISSIRKKNQNLVYNQINQPQGIFAVDYDQTSVFFRTQAYSSYQDNTSFPNLIIPGEPFSHKPVSSFKITRRIGGEKEISKIVVTVMSDLNEIANFKSQIPPSNFYKDNQYNVLPLNRNYFVGNNLEFTLNDGKGVTADSFYNANLFKYKFDESIQGIEDIYMINEHAAIGRIGNQIFALKCYLDFYNKSTTCTDWSSGESFFRYTLQEKEKVIYVTDNQFNYEPGAVVVVSDGIDSKFIYFGLKYKEAYMTTRKGLAIAEGEVFFKISGKHYAFWIKKKDKITILAVYNKEFDAMRELPFNTIDVKQMGGEQYDQFCPTQINKNPNDVSYVDVLSSCNGENRFLTFNALNITDGLSLQNNLLVDGPSGGEISYVCNLGEELLYAPKEQGDNAQLFAQPFSAPNTITDLQPSDAGYKSISGIHCVRDSHSAIVYGLDKNGQAQMSLIFGKNGLDARSRYHSTINYNGKEIYRVTNSNGNQVIVTFVENEGQDDVSFEFLHLFPEGPYLVVQSDVTKLNPTPQQTINLIQDGNISNSQEFRLSFTEYDEKVTFTRNTEGSTPPTTSGTYQIDSLGTLLGPIFGVSVSDENKPNDKKRMFKENKNGVQPGKVSIVSPLITQKEISSPSSVNTPLPTQIFQSTSHPYKVGLLTNSMSTITIYYKEDQFQYIDDIGFKSVVNTAGFNGSKLGYFFWLGICQEGGEYYLRWMTRTLNKDGFSGKNTGSLTRVTSEFNFKENQPYNLSFQEIGTDKLLIIAGQLRWIADVSRDQNQNWAINNPQMISEFTNNIEQIGSVELERQTILVYTIVGEVNLNFDRINSDGSVNSLGTYTPVTGYQIQKIDCKKLSSGPACLLFNRGVVINDISLTYDEYNDKIEVTKQANYQYFGRYSGISYAEWNEDYVILKSQIVKDAQLQGETMLFYKRDLSTGNQIDLGLEPESYYKYTNSICTPIDSSNNYTPSIPFLYRDNAGKTQVRFTQSQIQFASGEKQSNLQDPQYPPLTIGFELNQDPSFKFKIDADIWKDAAEKINIEFSTPKDTIDQVKTSQIGLTQFFSAYPIDPNNGGNHNGKSQSEPHWYFYVTLGFFIIFLILYVREVNKNSENSKFRNQTDEYTNQDDSAFKSMGENTAKAEMEDGTY